MMGMRGGPRGGRMGAGIVGVVALLMLLVGFVVAPAEEAGSSPGGVRSGAVLAGDGAWGLSGGSGDPIGTLPASGEPVAGAAGAAASTGTRAAAARPHRLVGLDAAQAAQVDREVFPGQLERPAGGLPSLPRGARVARIDSPHAVTIVLPHGRHAVVESVQPLAAEASSDGRLAPVDLGLRRVGGVFESVRPVVGVLMPRKLSEGVALPEAGVSLTPVDARGNALGGAEGQVDGASVIYANTQRAADTAFRPTLDGVEASTVLRAIGSADLYYRVGMPSGARLVQERAGAGAVRVLEGSRTVAVVRPPGALDADGREVPSSMELVKGDLLRVSVSVNEANVRAPIYVDPEIAIDSSLGPTECHQKGEAERESSNWCFHSGGKFSSEWRGRSEVALYNTGSVGTGEYSVEAYHTQGASKIYKLEVISSGEVVNGEARLELARPRPEEKGELEKSAWIAKNEWWKRILTTDCSNSECSSAGGVEGNIAAFKIEAQEPSGYLEGTLQYADVYIAQEKGPEASWNTTEEHPQGDPSRVNVAYTHGWLSPEQGAFEYIVHDPGIGVSEAGIQEMGGGNIHIIEKIYEAGKCDGVQCNQTYRSAVTYSPEMADGEDKFEVWGRDKTGLFGYTGFYEGEGPVIKVDGTPPGKREVTGWPARREISAAPHTLTVSARDEGPNGAKSSGVKSIAVSIDGGQETTIPGASCAEGPCTGSGTYTLHAEDLSEGVHRLVETATDNAGNVGSTEFTFDVRHASPVAVGPGTVDPTTGQFKLGASDVSLAGAGGVSRVYESRNLTAGAGGPLGPQWALSLGGGQGITQLPDGSVVLASSAGGTTTFQSNGKGAYESPLGDENIKLEGKEKEAGKGISEYLLNDAKAGTTTVFTQPPGTEETMPIYANQFGQEGANMGKPVSAAVDANGNVWVTDYTNDRVLEFSSAGVLLHSYGAEGEWLGDFKEPWGIAISKSTGNVYVSDPGNSRIVELNSSGQFVRAFGWAVSPGGERKEEFQDCTSYCIAGTRGTGAGQLDWPQGVAVDSSGNVWVAEYDSNRIQEFSAEGRYLGAYGSAGTGDGQFEGPLNIAFSGGDLYVTDRNNNRVQELTSAGVFVKAVGWGVSNGEAKLQVCTSGCRAGISGAGNRQFDLPWGLAINPAGDLYVSDQDNNRVQELTSAGAFVTKFGSAGSGNGQFSEPMGLAVGAQGEIYVADYANKRMQEWMRPTWLPARTEDALKHVTTAYAYEPVEEEGKVVVEPTEVLAATPPGITCVGEHGEVEVQYLKDGCRALSFGYAKATTAKGAAPSEWGDYNGRLSRVYFHAYNESTKAMATREVAHYLYDAQGRLRGEWDPRTEPKPESEECVKELLAKGCLATVYGYDEAGHVTSVTPPGQESWGLVYGTISSDSGTGRLLKATRAPASAKLWNGAMPVKTVSPALSGTPAVGTRMAVSNGTWSNSPVVYGYRWEDCNSSGGECAAILGATNENYTPVSGDVGHTLVAQVTATNGGGSVLAESAHSAVIAAQAGSYTQTVDSGYSLNAVSCISGGTTCVVSDSAGKALYSTNVSSSSAASWSSWSGVSGESPSEAVDCASSSLCLLAAGKDEGNGGNLYYATSLGGSWSLAYSPAYGVDAISCVSTSFCADGQDGYGYFRWSTSPASTSWNLQQQNTAAMKAISCLSASFCAIADSKGSVHIATTESQVKSSSWTETSVDGSTALNGIACMSRSLCVAVDSSGNALVLKVESGGGASAAKHDIDGTKSLSGVACPSSTSCVAVDTAGHVLVTNNSGETWSTLYSLGDDLSSVSCASASLCVAPDTAGKVTAFNLTGTGTEGEAHSPQPGSTIEYRVPTSGGGVPQNLSKEEVEKWGQKDDPVEGTAIFAPDEPQSWPASKYTRASLDYMDEEGRTVNTVAPTGGVATSEYNEANEVTRALSADNRATAMGEGCVSVSKKECKSAEVAEKLSEQTEYNEEDSEIVRTLAPEHKVKLSNGEEVEERAVTHDYYDEGSEEAEEKNEEEYNLLTKSVSGALLPNGEEKEKRTTLTGYSGQEGLGWKLREPTSTIVDPTGRDLVSSTKYNATTGAVEETRSPGGNAESVSPPEPKLRFGSEGTGDGEFKRPEALAVSDSSGDEWVLDTGNSRIEKFSPGGAFLAAYGSAGTGPGQFKGGWGIAVNQKTGNVYVADSGNDRVEELNEKGEYLREWGVAGSGEGEFEDPVGVAIDGSGHVWVSDYEDDHVQEFSEAGVFMQQFGSKGAGDGQFEHPGEMAFSQGVLYVVDEGNKRVQEFSTTAEAKAQYVGQFGSSGGEPGQFKDPWGIAAAPVTGDLWVSDEEGDTVSQFSPAGKYLGRVGWYGTGEIEFEGPTGLAVNASGSLYVADQYNDRISVWQEPEVGGAHMSYSTQFGTSGKGEGQFENPAVPAVDPHGDVWVSDYSADRIEKFSSQGKFLASYGEAGTGNGQYYGPTGVAVDQATEDVYVGDCYNHRIQELGPKGEFVRAFTSSQLKCPGAIAIDGSGNVWTVDMVADEVEEFSSTGTFLHAYGSKGKGDLQFEEPVGIAIANNKVYVADAKNDRVQELSMTGEYLGQFGKEGPDGGEFYGPEGVAANSAGDLFVMDHGNDRVEEFSPTTKYLQSISGYGHGEGELDGPQGIAVTAAGDMYVADAVNHRVQKWVPDTQAVHDTRTIYYSPEKEAGIEACQNKPQWAGLPCRTEPVAQPEDAKEGEPSLPVSTMTYNLWDEVLVTKEEFGTGSKVPVREKIQTYDAAGRALTSEEKAFPAGEEEKPIDTALPQVTNEYNSETGALEKQRATIEGESKTVTAKDNTLGQLVEYEDAEGNVAKYVYEEGGDARLLEVSEGKGAEGASKQVYSYNATTGFMEKLVDSAAGTFTASYDLEGKLTSEVYPNGMCANTSYDSTGMARSISYIKTRNCSETGAPVWFSDSQVPGVYGETMAQTSTLSSESYAYDSTGRLLETQETPAGKGCTTRVYAYDEESNRTSLITRAPGSEGKCAAEGGAVERHTYDEANRLTDEGVEYEALGNTTKLPAADAGEHEIKSTYYLDNQVATQEQNHVLDSYLYDPAGRTMQTSSENTETEAKTTLVSHYAGPGEAVTWTSEGAEKWSRNIPGIDGSLQAIEETDKVVVLQLHDLQGNIVAAASDNESETKLISTYNSTEFGVPSEGKTPPKYAWLGASGLATETAFGTGISTQGGASYVPQVARNLQTAPVIPPGAFPNGQGTGEQYDSEIPGWYISLSGEESAATLAEYTAHQEALKREAEEEARNASGGGSYEEEGGYEQEELSSITFTPSGGGAHAADVISCGIFGRYPHYSTHVAGTVNWVVKVECTRPVVDLELRLELRWDNEPTAETGWVSLGSTGGEDNVDALCLNGWWHGHAQLRLTAPPGYVGRTKLSVWSLRRYIVCKRGG